MDVMSVVVVTVGGIGLAGMAAEAVALVRRRGRRLALAGLILRACGVIALFALVLAGRGRPDFEDLVFVIYGMFAGIALWSAAAVCDLVLVLRHLLKREAE